MTASEQYRLLMADVYELAGLSRRTSEAIARGLGQTVARWHVLSVVSAGPCTVPAIARRLGLTRQGVQRVTDELLAARLLMASRNPGHARSPLLTLTGPGELALEQLTQRSDAARGRVLQQAHITAEDLAVARSTVRTLLESLATSDRKLWLFPAIAILAKACESEPLAARPPNLRGMPVLRVMQELWDRTAGTQAVPPSWVVAASAALALVVVLDARTWHLARNVITIAHEGGHALVSVLTGRRLDGIRLHSDTSGVTYSRGRRTGPGAVLTSAAGYLSPPLLGLLAAWLLAAHHVTAMLWLMLVLLAATFLAIRNAYGLLAVLVTAGAVLAVSWLASAAVQAAFGYADAFFLLLGGVRPVIELQRERHRGSRGSAGGSDADRLARLTGVPGGLWVALFLLVSVTALVLGAGLLLPSALHMPHLSALAVGGEPS